MAIFIENTTCCPLCHREIMPEQTTLAFPAMVWNELDPLWPISDAVAHVDCLQSHGLLRAATTRQQAVRAATGPGNRECKLCKEQIANPEDHIMLGHLTDDATEPLYHFNLAQFHRSCLSKWSGFSNLIQELKAYNSRGLWRGSWLPELILNLESVHGDKRS